MKCATWNINECVGITCDLNDQKTTDTININNINEIIEKINEYDSINIVNLPEKERLDKVKNNKYFRKKRDFLKKLIIINNSLKTDFKTIEVE